MDTRISQLEQRLARLEHELIHTRGELSSAESRSRTVSRRGRLLIGGAAVALAAITAGTASAHSTSASPGPQPLTVTAPFRVVNASGKTVLLVDNDGMLVSPNGDRSVQVTRDQFGGRVNWYDLDGKATGGLFVSSDGVGAVAVGSPGAFQATLGSKANKMGLRFSSAGQLVAGIGESELGGAILLNSPSGTRQAYLGETADGGQVALNAPDGSLRAALGAKEGDTGFADIYSNSNTVVAKMAGDANGGYFALTNNSGISRVEEGVLSGDTGDVRTFGPKGFNYIKGRG